MSRLRGVLNFILSSRSTRALAVAAVVVLTCVAGASTPRNSSLISRGASNAGGRRSRTGQASLRAG